MISARSPNSLEDVLVVQPLVLHQIPPVVHAAGVGHERRGLREAEDEAAQVRAPASARVRAAQALCVRAREGGLQAQASDGADVADGLDRELDGKKDER